MINMDEIDIAVIQEKLKNIDERVTELSNSYKILNDNHHQLELDMMELDTQISTIANLVKWIISPGMIIALLIELARIGGIIT